MNRDEFEELNKKIDEKAGIYQIGNNRVDEDTPSQKIKKRIRELEIELIELKALSNILATEPLIDKLLSGEQGRKLKGFLY